MINDGSLLLSHRYLGNLPEFLSTLVTEGEVQREDPVHVLDGVDATGRGGGRRDWAAGSFAFVLESNRTGRLGGTFRDLGRGGRRDNADLLPLLEAGTRRLNLLDV